MVLNYILVGCPWVKLFKIICLRHTVFVSISYQQQLRVVIINNNYSIRNILGWKVLCITVNDGMTESWVNGKTVRDAWHLYLGSWCGDIPWKYQKMSNLGDITPGVVWSNLRNNTPGSPVAQHFNSRRATVFLNVRVRGVALCSGTNIQKKQREMKLIFQLGTVQPKGLNFILRAQAYALRSFLCLWQLRITMVSSDWGRVIHPKGLFFFS